MYLVTVLPQCRLSRRKPVCRWEGFFSHPLLGISLSSWYYEGPQGLSRWSDWLRTDWLSSKEVQALEVLTPWSLSNPLWVFPFSDITSFATPRMQVSDCSLSKARGFFHSSACCSVSRGVNAAENDQQHFPLGAWICNTCQRQPRMALPHKEPISISTLSLLFHGRLVLRLRFTSHCASHQLMDSLRTMTATWNGHQSFARKPNTILRRKGTANGVKQSALKPLRMTRVNGVTTERSPATKQLCFFRLPKTGRHWNQGDTPPTLP